MTLCVKSPRLLLATAALATLPLALPAQTLRLDDLFTTGTATGELTLADLDDGGAARVLMELPTDLDAGRLDALLRKTELLAAWFPPDGPDYARTLYFRARAFHERGERDALVQVAQIYLDAFPRGEDRAWFYRRMAGESLRQGKPASAAVFWELIVDQQLPTPPDEALDGVAVLLANHQPATARALLALAFSGDAAFPPELTARRDAALLDTLLVLDDPSVPLPPEHADHHLRFRRALVMEIRGDRDAAMGVYQSIQEDVEAAAPLRARAAERLAALGTPLWPPPGEMPATAPTADPNS